jgi:hypothetical protein
VERGLTHWQRGRFVVTIQEDVAGTLLTSSQVTVDQFLTGRSGIIYERALANVLRPEIR